MKFLKQSAPAGDGGLGEEEEDEEEKLNSKKT